MCLYPTLIKNPKYKENKKNGGQIPAVLDIRTLYVPIGCQRCIECRRQKARSWQVRMLEDIKTNTNGKFVTLTFSDQSIYKLNKIIQDDINQEIDKIRHGRQFGEQERNKINKLTWKRTGYELDNAIATYAMRYFNERWRKHTGKAIRHWAITELGHTGTENIHLHGIVWTDETFETIAKRWDYGYIWPNTKKAIKKNYVNAKTVNYSIKYILKQDADHKEYRAKILTSPGIGSNYTETYNAKTNEYKPDGKTIETYRTKSGHQISMPIYWRNKIYSEEERELLWIQKLDKQERWIQGERISIKNGMDEYYKTLEWYRKRNIELGYGTNENNWRRKEYEEANRIIMQETRIKNAQQKI